MTICLPLTRHLPESIFLDICWRNSMSESLVVVVLSLICLRGRNWSMEFILAHLTWDGVDLLISLIPILIRVFVVAIFPWACILLRVALRVLWVSSPKYYLTTVQVLHLNIWISIIRFVDKALRLRLGSIGGWLHVLAPAHLFNPLGSFIYLLPSFFNFLLPFLLWLAQSVVRWFVALLCHSSVFELTFSHSSIYGLLLRL